MANTYLNLDTINAYSIPSGLADRCWEIISQWDTFNKQTLGVQYQKAIDSIAGNVAEGFGRFYKKDKQRFYYFARGSLYESLHWTKKAWIRKLLTQEEHDQILRDLTLLPREINWLIKITEEKLTK